MNHPNPEFHSPFHAGAHRTLRDSTAYITRTVARLNALNPGLSLSDPPTLDQLAAALETNELRRSGQVNPD